MLYLDQMQNFERIKKNHTLNYSFSVNAQILPAHRDSVVAKGWMGWNGCGWLNRETVHTYEVSLRTKCSKLSCGFITQTTKNHGLVWYMNYIEIKLPKY